MRTQKKVIRGDFPLTKIPSSFPNKIDESLALGLDIGVGSCGQALVYDDAKDKVRCRIKRVSQFPGRIAFLGVRAFEIPEINTTKGIKLKNPERRQKKLMRRTIRRRAWRMWSIKKLLRDSGLLPATYPIDKKIWKGNPKRGENLALDQARDWHSQMTKGKPGIGIAGPLQFRVDGLKRQLENEEFAAALLHLAKHRGFKSSKKSESLDEEGGKILAAISENGRRMQCGGYRTYAEMLLKDPEFKNKKRNSDRTYKSTPLRALLSEEINQLFAKQREFGNLFASEELQDAFTKIFSQQKGLQNSFNLLGYCPIFSHEKRGSRFSYSFEISRALQKLNTLSLSIGGTKHRLADFVNASEGGYEAFIVGFASFGTKTCPGRITWKDLRKVFSLDDEVKFVDLPSPRLKKKNGKEIPETEDEIEKQDFVTRNTSNTAAKGSYLLRSALGRDLWEEFAQNNSAALDAVAFALSFFEEIENDYGDQKQWGVVNEMEFRQLDERLIGTVRDDLAGGQRLLAKFSGGVSLSSKASRTLIPFLKTGLVYSAACEEAFGKIIESDFSLDSVTNPVVVSVVRECLKQVIHLIDETGSLPGRIVVELARDMGKSNAERDEITRGLKKRTNKRNENRSNLEHHICRKPTDDELVRYELWLEQDNFCPYCGGGLGKPVEIVESDYEVDHILPRSRSHDNSYKNRVLVHRRCNQGKRNNTPFEWSAIGNCDLQSTGWKEYVARIHSMRRVSKEKRKHLLNTTFGEDETVFARRHLVDTQYIARLVIHHLESIYTVVPDHEPRSEGGARRVFAQPGALTALVRKSWGLEGLKKDENGRRIGDKHHAVDALVCALLSEGQRQFVTKMEQGKRDAAKLAQGFSEYSRVYQLMEEKNDHHFIPRKVSAPWHGFREDVVGGLELFTVSRSENRKGRGHLHDETVYRVEVEENQDVYYSRKTLIDYSQGKAKSATFSLDDVKDIHHEKNQWLKSNLKAWVENGRPISNESLPRDPQGCVIKRVTVRQKIKSGRKYPRGYVAGGNLIRVDVYSRPGNTNRKKYFFVPIYSYHLASSNLPVKAITRGRLEKDWLLMTSEYLFEFSLWKNSRFKALVGNEWIDGLFKGINRNTERIAWANPDFSAQNTAATKAELQLKPLSLKTGAKAFDNIFTDRLGRIYVVKSKRPTWRGKMV